MLSATLGLVGTTTLSCTDAPRAPSGAVLSSGGQVTGASGDSSAIGGTASTVTGGASAGAVGGVGGGADHGGTGPSAGTSALAGSGGGDGCGLYVAPNGAGAACTAQVPCSLTGARDKVRTINANLTEDLQVCLAGGMYWLSETLELIAQDSGSGGFSVIYRNLDAQAPVLSGGRAISGFELFDANKQIFRALAPGLSSRQLFVNGRRAIRARSKDNYGMTRNEHGFTANTTALASFKNPMQIELSGELDWRHYRCPVESIVGNNVRLQSPCWELSQDVPAGGWWPFKQVSWVENAYELLDNEGEFYLDETAGQLFYKPRQGEDMAVASVIAPVLETLLSGQGSVAQPLHHVAFRGLTFSHATWAEPSTSVGYTSWQSGFLHRTLGQYYDSGFFVMPANLRFEAVDSLRFEGNTFEHLGAGGIDIYHASRNNSLVGNRFNDISGRAITLGHIDDYAAPAEETIRNNLIKNNAIFHSGVEYRDCAIIFVGYTQDTVIEHNWLRYGPYIGVSLGWGWSSHPESTAGRNMVRFNRIEDFMQHTFDGSAVYALGPQRDSSVDHNYILRGLPRGEGLFPDQGAAYMSWQWNVIENVGWEWLHDWSAAAHHNNISHNITDQPKFEHSGADKHDIFEDNRVVTGGNWPPEALEIKAKAGLEPDFAHLAP